MIPYGRQHVDDDDAAALLDALRSGWLTQGPAIARFEEALAAATGAPHVVAMANGTAALHAACVAADLSGARVGVPSLTFAASAAAVLHAGGTPVLLDLDPATLNLRPDALPPDLDALVAVHYAGLPVDLASLPTRPRVVIEDAAHALGASTPSGPVGSCADSDLCCFSFHPVKPITTGEGGAVTTRDAALADRLRRFRSHETVPTPERGGWAYDVAQAGFNYRLTDLQAALGTSQLRKLPAFLARREELAQRYRAALAGTPVGLPPEAPPGSRHALHLFPVRVPHRRAVYDGMRARGIHVQVHYVPLHHHTAFRALERVGDLAATDEAYEQLLSLPLFPDLSDADQDLVVETLLQLVGGAA